jgi:exonuclease SbcC
MAAEDVSADDDFRKVATACEAVRSSGRVPTVKSVLEYLRQHLGGGMRTALVAELVKHWQAAQEKPAARRAKAAPAEEAVPTLDDVLAQHPDLMAAMEVSARAMAKVLADRAQSAAEERVAAIQSAVEVARDEAAKRLEEVRADHRAELDERDKAVDALQAEQVSVLEQLEETKAALSERDVEIERLRQELALTKTDARTATARATEAETKLSVAEGRATDAEGRAAALERDLAGVRAELAAAQQSLAAATEGRTQLAGLVDGLRSDIAAERSRNDALHERIEALTREAAGTGQAEKKAG